MITNRDNKNKINTRYLFNKKMLKGQLVILVICGSLCYPWNNLERFLYSLIVIIPLYVFLSAMCYSLVSTELKKKETDEYFRSFSGSEDSEDSRECLKDSEDSREEKN